MTVDFYKELLEDRLGLHILGLESRFKELIRFFNRVTLPTFGRYIPCYFYHYLDLSDEILLISEDRGRIGREYYIKNEILEKYNLKILSIESVQICSDSLIDPENTNYYSAVYSSRSNMSIEDMLIGGESTYMRLATDFAIPFQKYFQYRGEKVLFLQHYPFNTNVQVKIKTQYPNLASIPEEFRETLLDLAKLDIRYKLWEEFKYMENIVTPDGDGYDLKISEWSNAERERTEFLKELRVTSFPDRINNNCFYPV